MLIAQLTDLHVGFDHGNHEEANLQRLRAVLRRLAEGPNRPDLLLLTGDLTEHGDVASFALLADELRALPVPAWLIPGNHDTRDGLAAAFPHIPRNAEGFFQYAFEAGGLRLLMLDTLEEGRHGGSFCERRAAWLADQLAAAPTAPTLVVMHHPPFTAGIPWMDTHPSEPWVARFGEVVRGHQQIVGVACGHLHRTILTRWNGLTMFACPSTAPPVGLDLNPIDPGTPDGRTLISNEPAAYGLHRWDGQSLVSHFEAIAGLDPLARYEDGLQGMVGDMMSERPA